MGVFELLEEVKDRESFIAFVKALAEEHELAEKMERAEPEKFRFCGALGWENRSISSFLEAALACAEDGSYLQEASWRGLRYSPLSRPKISEFKVDRWQSVFKPEAD